MEKQTHYITHYLEVEVLTPLHIGNGEELTSVGEFITHPSKIEFLDQEAFIKSLSKEQRQTYIEKIVSAGQQFDFVEVLKELGVSYEDKVIRSIPLNHKELDTKNNNPLQCCIKTQGEAYIPGSSIKGMLRTAVLAHFLEKEPYALYEIEANFNEMGSKKAIMDYWLKQEKNILLENRHRQYGAVFHNIRPVDSTTVSDEKLVIEQVRRQHFFGVDSDNLDWLSECIAAGTHLPFQLNIIPNFPYWYFIAEALNSGKVSRIFNIINRYSKKTIAHEIKLLQKSTQPEAKELITKLKTLLQEIKNAKSQYAITRIGKGKTLFFQTFLPLLSEETQEKIIQLLRKEDEQGDFPQSRVLTVKDNQMMGWVKIKHLDTETF